jgi:hypothetical protein
MVANFSKVVQGVRKREVVENKYCVVVIGGVVLLGAVKPSGHSIPRYCSCFWQYADQ